VTYDGFQLVAYSNAHRGQERLAEFFEATAETAAIGGRVRRRRHGFGMRPFVDRLFALTTLGLGLIILSIWFGLALSPFADWQRQAWAGALVLTCIVLALEIGVRWMTRGAVQVPR